MRSEDEFKKGFGKRLSTIRRASGYTQIKLAEKLNYSDKAISKWERGESVPDTYTVFRLAEVLNITPDLLFDEEDGGASHEELNNVKKRKRPLEIFVPIISSIGVIFIASVLFLIFKLIDVTTQYAPYIYMLALPVIFIELVVFAFLWWKKPLQIASVSMLIWSVGGAAYGTVQLFTDLYDFKYIFICCAILQTICFIAFLFEHVVKKNKKHE